MLMPCCRPSTALRNLDAALCKHLHVPHSEAGKLRLAAFVQMLAVASEGSYLKEHWVMTRCDL